METTIGQGFRAFLVRHARKTAGFAFAWIAVGMLASCVPYQTYEDLRGELEKQNQVNRAVEARVLTMETEIAQAQGAGGITSEQSASLRAQLDASRLENASYRDKINLLEERLREIPELVAGDGNGFDPGAFVDSGAVVVDGAIVLDDELLFGAGKTELRDSSKKALDRVSDVIKTQHSRNLIHIIGHTDNTPIKVSGHKDNWELGAKRAHAVFEYLTKKKGHADTHFRIHSYGFAMPYKGVDPNSASGKAKCRRVEIRLGPELPGE